MYSADDYLKLRGEIVDFVVGYSATQKTQILSVEDLSFNHRALVGMLMKLSVLPKFVRKNLFQEYQTRGRQNERARTMPHTIGHAGNRRTFDPTSVGHYPPGRYTSELNGENAKAATPEGSPSVVEVGVAILKLKDGRTLTAFHTSSQTREISGESFEAAVDNILIGRGVSPQQIAGIEYFHNHPSPLPLSRADVDAGHSLQLAFSGAAGTKVDVHVFAIMSFGETLVLNHYSE